MVTAEPHIRKRGEGDGGNGKGIHRKIMHRKWVSLFKKWFLLPSTPQVRGNREIDQGKHALY